LERDPKNVPQFLSGLDHPNDIVRTTLVEILEKPAPDKVQLRALNILTVLSPEALRPAREAIAKLSEGQEEYLHSAAKYLLLTIDGGYRPDVRVIGMPDYKVNIHRPIGDPQI
jgi:hypothetical protein